MQINDLPQGTPTPSDVVPFNTNGLDYKATMEDITELVEVSEKPVTFTSDDEETPTAYKTMATLASGALNTLMGILSKAVSNVRFLYSKLTELTTQVNTNTDDIATLNSNINDLNSLLSVKTGTFASAISGAQNNLNVWQSGNVVTVSGWIGSLSLAANTTTVIGTIRNVTLPKSNIRLRGGCGANAYSSQSDCYIGIGTDGGISVNPAVAASTLYFSVSYVA